MKGVRAQFAQPSLLSDDTDIVWVSERQHSAQRGGRACGCRCNWARVMCIHPATIRTDRVPKPFASRAYRQ